MSKHEMIEQIRQRNPSVSLEFLLDFEEAALRRYLDRLTTLKDRRGRQSVWVRPSTAPAVTWRACA